MLKIGRGAAAPPFLVMDVIAAANARQAALPAGAAARHPHGGRPARHRRARRRAWPRRGRAAVAATRSATPRRSAGARCARASRAHYRDWYGLDVPLERIAVTVGASGAFPLAFLAAFDPGDRIALAAPFYPPYVNILTALGMRPVILEAGPDTPLPAERRDAGAARSAAGRADRRQPLQPGRHDAASRTNWPRSPPGATAPACG